MSRPTRIDSRLLACALLLPFASCMVPSAGGEPRIHSQRPFISRDTQTTQESVVAVETGAAIDPGDAVEVPVLIRYGLGPQTEMFAGTSPYKMVDHDEVLPDGSGWGDTYVGFRHRMREQDIFSPAYGFQVQTKLPSADQGKGLGSGAIDWHVAGMATQTYYGFETTAYYQLGILDEVATNGVDHGHTLALQTRLPVDVNLTAFAEAAFEWAPERDFESITVMGGASFLLDSLTVVDVALRVGAGNDAPDVQILFGFSRAIGELFFPEQPSSSSRR